MKTPSLLQGALAGLFLVGCATTDPYGGEQPLGGSSGKADSALGSYSPSDAVTYADNHWNDGQGLCSEFTTRSLRAGGLPIDVIAYVPTLVHVLSDVAYDEHNQGDSPTASAGDVVVYSDANGGSFCPASSSDEYNCGHVCIAVTGGSGESGIEVDCHNNAHYHLALGAILGGGYSTYRVYHLAGHTAPPGTVPCTTDYDCNQGTPGTEDVCAAGEGYCIRACHSDFDCATGTCAPTQPHWTCQ